MTAFKILNVYYTPGNPSVTIAVQALDGPFAGQVKDLFTTQEALKARSQTNWDDAAVEAEADAQLGLMNSALEKIAIDPGAL